MYIHNRFFQKVTAILALWLLCVAPAYADLVTKPYTFVAGQTLPASSLNSDFDTIYNNYNGNITDANVKSTAAISISKLALIGNNTILGNISGGSATPSALTATQATTILNVFTSGLKGLAPASGGGTTNFLRADGTWATPPGGGTINSAGAFQIPYYSGTNAISGNALITSNTFGTLFAGDGSTGAGTFQALAETGGGSAGSGTMTGNSAGATLTLQGQTGASGGAGGLVMSSQTSGVGSPNILGNGGISGRCTIVWPATTGTAHDWTVPTVTVTEVTTQATAGQLVASTATGARSYVAAPGASGNILTSNGSVWTSAAPGSLGFGGNGSDGTVTTFTSPFVNAVSVNVTTSTGPTAYAAATVNSTTTQTYGNGCVLSLAAKGYGGGNSTTATYAATQGGGPCGGRASTGAATNGGGGGGGAGTGGAGGGIAAAVHLATTSPNLTNPSALMGVGSGGGGGGGTGTVTTNGNGGAGGGMWRFCAIGAITTSGTASISSNGNAGGNAGTATSCGGGGGAAGDIFFYSQTSINLAAGTVTAAGGAGGSGGATSGGGGGGGGGGHIVLMSPSNTNSLVTATACAGGAGGTTKGGGVAALAGNQGNVLTITGTPTMPLLGYLETKPGRARMYELAARVGDREITAGEAILALAPSADAFVAFMGEKNSPNAKSPMLHNVIELKDRRRVA